MINRMLQPALALTLVMLATWVQAGAPVEKAVEDKIRAALEIPSMGLKVGSVELSEIPGIFEVQFTSGPVVYSTAGGDYFIAGDMYAVKDGSPVNLAEQRRGGERLEQLAGVEREDMIIFSPEGEPRSHITVFTDISCFYCQKLHKEVPELNKRGVEVRYLGYPRAGVGSDAYRQLATAWCADNPQDALTKLKNKQSVPDNVCADNPIAAQYQLGQQMGVSGTPALITESGALIPGYQSADDLMVTLGLE